MMFRPATIITHFNCKEKTATTIIYDQENNGRSFREMVKVDEQGIVKQYKFKWLGNAKKM